MITPTKFIIVIAGPPGSGKTTQGDILLQNYFISPNDQFLSLGRELRKKFPNSEVSLGRNGLGDFHQKPRKKSPIRNNEVKKAQFVNQVIESCYSKWKEAGGVLVIDGDLTSFLKSRFDDFTEKSVLLIELTADVDVLKNRCDNRNEPRERLFTERIKTYDNRNLPRELYHSLSTELDTSVKSKTEIAESIRIIVCAFKDSISASVLSASIMKSLRSKYLSPWELFSFLPENVNVLNENLHADYFLRPKRNGIHCIAVYSKDFGFNLIQKETLFTLPPSNISKICEFSEISDQANIDQCLLSGVFFFNQTRCMFEFSVDDVFLIESREVWTLSFRKRLDLLSPLIKSINLSGKLHESIFLNFFEQFSVGEIASTKKDTLKQNFCTNETYCIPPTAALISSSCSSCFKDFLSSRRNLDIDRLKNEFENVSIDDQDNAKESIHESFEKLKLCSFNCDSNLQETYDSVLSTVEIMVHNGLVEKNLDETKSLAIYSYTTLGKKDPKTASFRGIILDIENKVIVSRPMKRFPRHKLCDEIDPDSLGHLFYDKKEIWSSQLSKENILSCSIKLDGSMIIVVNHCFCLIVSTRRRFDSEQANFARDWLKINDYTENDFLEGHTYIFELVGGDNTHIVNYPFCGLVLLTIMDKNGIELDFSALTKISVQLNMLMTPTFKRPNITFNIEGVTQEGWVLKVPEGRTKLIYPEWDLAWIAARYLDPLFVWRLLATNHEADSRYNHFSAHHLLEKEKMSNIFFEQFSRVFQSFEKKDDEWQHIDLRFRKTMEDSFNEMQTNRPCLSECLFCISIWHVIRPKLNSDFKDYKPSKSMLQTFAKRWKSFDLQSSTSKNMNTNIQLIPYEIWEIIFKKFLEDYCFDAKMFQIIRSVCHFWKKTVEDSFWFEVDLKRCQNILKKHFESRKWTGISVPHRIARGGSDCSYSDLGRVDDFTACGSYCGYCGNCSY
ncbi:hypothetical protein HK096_002585 [Nowakowskiella sp. JEL0078]|nr:hypothetical protein HK096_002585 [Nowakowskiella sp. JEL0078]